MGETPGQRRRRQRVLRPRQVLNDVNTGAMGHPGEHHQLQAGISPRQRAILDGLAPSAT